VEGGGKGGRLIENPDHQEGKRGKIALRGEREREERPAHFSQFRPDGDLGKKRGGRADFYYS